MSRFSGRGDAVPEVADPDLYDPATDCYCGTCGVQFNGSDASGGHHRGDAYGGCCQSFASMNSFEKHFVRVKGEVVRCLTVAEMQEKGWQQTGPYQSWRTPPPKNNPWKKAQ